MSAAVRRARLWDSCNKPATKQWKRCSRMSSSPRKHYDVCWNEGASTSQTRSWRRRPGEWLSALEQGSHAAFSVDSPSPDVWIELGPHDVAVAAEALERDVEAHLRSAILKTEEAVGPKLLRAIKKNAPRMLCNNRSSVLAFRAELRRQWHPVIDLLDTLILVAEHSGDRVHVRTSRRVPSDGVPER